MHRHFPSIAGAVFVAALLSDAAQGQRGASAAPAFATVVLRSDSIEPNFVTTSPDGRWIVFAGIVHHRNSLWIMPASGGAPRRLGSTATDIGNPVWFPSSDRIAYVSTPSGTVMTQAIDSPTGTAKGTPQRVTLDDAESLDVSPDGSLIAYTTSQRSDGKARLQVVPARGGPARVIHSAARFRWQPRFAPDGQSIYVTVAAAEKKPSQLFRVPVSGGTATVVRENQPSASASMMMTASANVVWLFGPKRLSAVTLSGDTLWSISKPPSSPPTRLASDGKSMLLATSEIGAAIRLIPVNGGAARDITPGDTYDYPTGWSADGQRIYVNTGMLKEKGLLAVSVDGKDREFIPFAADSGWSGSPRIVGDGRFWAWPHQSSPSDRYLYVYDTKTRALTAVAHSADLREITGPGGYWTSAPELYFLDRGANSMELRSLSGDGQLRMVRRLSFDLPPDVIVSFADVIVSFANDRLAYWVTAGDSAVLYVADHDLAPKRVYAFRGSVTYAALSFDGSALAATTLSGPAGGTARYNVTMLGITPSGALAGPPRSILTSAVWDLMWLRDNRSLLALEDIDNGLTTRVDKFTMGSDRSVNVTPGAPMTFWDQYPSPDGRWTAIPVEKARGGTIWRIDLEAAAKAWQARTRK